MIWGAMSSDGVGSLCFLKRHCTRLPIHFGALYAYLQKRGKRGCIRARLRGNPTRTAIPSLMLSNVRSLENKLELIQLSRSTQHETRDCCVFVFTETWLNDNIPDSAIQLHGLSCCRADRDSSLSGKLAGAACVCISTKNGVTMLRYYQNTVHRWWSLWL